MIPPASRLLPYEAANLQKLVDEIVLLSQRRYPSQTRSLNIFASRSWPAYLDTYSKDEVRSYTRKICIGDIDNVMMDDDLDMHDRICALALRHVADLPKNPKTLIENGFHYPITDSKMQMIAESYLEAARTASPILQGKWPQR